MKTATLSDYNQFLLSKYQFAPIQGFEVEDDALNKYLFPFQRESVKYALKLGKAALFQECGLGKSLQELAWAEQVAIKTGKKVLILTPLAVAHQFVTEGKKFGINCVQVKSQKEAEKADSMVLVTNYEKLEKFDASSFGGVVLDESSILKNYMGKTKQLLIESFKNTQYKLCATATPAPNDNAEFGNHAEFLDVSESSNMLMRYFQHDSGDTKNWSLKPHAADSFWLWVASWSTCISKPSDLGFSDDGYDLPPLNIKQHIVEVDHSATWEETGQLVRTGNLSATNLHKEMKLTARVRAVKAREVYDSLKSEDNKHWVIWCWTDYEAEEVMNLFPEAVEIHGKLKQEQKEERFIAFSDGEIDVLVIKPKIGAFGLNWVHCHNSIFVGMSHQWEAIYQASRRFYRFGQTKPVTLHLISAETEGSILDNFKFKQSKHDEMQVQMKKAMQKLGLVVGDRNGYDEYNPQVEMSVPSWLVSVV